MANTIFRTALSGFNRQDVMAYIEKTQKEAAEAAQQQEEQIRSLQEQLDAAQEALDACTQEKEALDRELTDANLRYTHAKTQWDAQRTAREALETDVTQRDEAVRTLTAENQELFHRVQELEEQSDTVRREKAQVAQLELEAQEKAAATLQQAEDQVAATVEQYTALFDAFSTITSHVTSELRKMDVTVSQLPISFNHLQDSLQEVLARAKER